MQRARAHPSCEDKVKERFFVTFSNLENFESYSLTLFSFVIVRCYIREHFCKARFSLDENSLAKMVFGSSSSKIHIFGCTDPFFMRFFATTLSSPTESEKNTSMILSSNRKYRLWSPLIELPHWWFAKISTKKFTWVCDCLSSWNGSYTGRYYCD